MKRIISLILVLSVFAVMASGCGNESEESVEIRVPDLIGKKYDSIISDKQYIDDFVFIKQNEVLNEKYEKGYIVSQNPAPGTKVEIKGYRVYLTVSKGMDLSIQGTWKCERYQSEYKYTYYMYYNFYENGSYQLYSETNNEKHLIETGDYQFTYKISLLSFKNRIRSEYAKENFTNNEENDYSITCELKDGIIKLHYSDTVEIFNKV